MRRPVGAKREVLMAVMSTIVAALGAIDLVGQPARTVHIIMIFAGGLGAGIALARAIERTRAERREKAAASGPGSV